MILKRYNLLINDQLPLRSILTLALNGVNIRPQIELGRLLKVYKVVNLNCHLFMLITIQSTEAFNFKNANKSKKSFLKTIIQLHYSK